MDFADYDARHGYIRARLRLLMTGAPITIEGTAQLEPLEGARVVGIASVLDITRC